MRLSSAPGALAMSRRGEILSLYVAIFAALLSLRACTFYLHSSPFLSLPSALLLNSIFAALGLGGDVPAASLCDSSSTSSFS